MNITSKKGIFVLYWQGKGLFYMNGIKCIVTINNKYDMNM